VEYRLSGISQVAVSDKAGMTFAAGLRSILRQDPTVRDGGEIATWRRRDRLPAARPATRPLDAATKTRPAR